MESFRPLYFARFDEKSDIWNFVPHAHDCFEALYFLYGNARIALPERSFYATFADVVVYPPGVLHTEHLQLDHHQEVYCLQFSAADLALREVLHCHDASGQIRLLLDGIAAEYVGGAADEDVLGCYVRTLSALLLRSLRAGPGSEAPVERVMMYLRDHMAEEITIEELAQLAHLSPSHLIRTFSKSVGVSPIRYLQNIRIEAAKSLLMATNLDVGEVSAAVGFGSPKYFWRVFRAATGMSPRDFRRREALCASGDKEQDRAPFY